MAEQENGWRIGLQALDDEQRTELQTIIDELGPEQTAAFTSQVRDQLQGEQRADFDALNPTEQAQVVASIIQQQDTAQEQMVGPMDLHEMVIGMGDEQKDALRQLVAQLPAEQREEMLRQFTEISALTDQQAEFEALPADDKDLVMGFLLVQQMQQMQGMGPDGAVEEEEAVEEEPGLRGLLSALAESDKVNLRRLVMQIDPIQKITLRQQVRAGLPDEQKAEYDSFTDEERDVILAFILVQQQQQQQQAQNLQQPRRSPLLP